MTGGRDQRARRPRRELRLQQPSRAARRRPPSRPVSRRDRGLALAGVSVLLLVGLVAFISIVSSGGGEDPERSSAAQAPQADATPEATPAPERPTPTPTPGLTPAERRARAAARATVRAQGFRPVARDTWQAENRLRVIVGEAQPESGMRGRKAFFFLGGDYLGTDAEAASTKLRVLRQGDVTVWLRYGIFEPDDAPCCPEGEPVTVRYRWNGSQLVPLDAVPDAALRLR